MVVIWLALVASVLFAHSPTASVATANSKLNGWFPCHNTVRYPKAPPPAIVAPFECAEVQVPLCHEGICTSTKTINLFVKRLLAKEPTTPREAMWFLEGGPGYASTGMEEVMKIFNATTQMTVDMYTLDHRGTGRSNYLECQAAQAFAAGSPEGVQLDFAEIPNCIKDIMFQIDNKTEAFSVTSAAMDVEYLIDALHEKETEVFVYGGSYGTYWGERLMHLAPKKVKGYILDGVVDEKSATFSSWNVNRKYAAARFLKVCEEDEFCSSKLSKMIKAHEGSLAAAIRELYNRLDTAKPGEDECADLMQKFSGKGVKPSHGLRNFLGGQIQSDPTRIIVPAILHRLYMCRPKDVVFLKSYMKITSDDSEPPATTPPPTAIDMVMSNSEFLSSLIKASEIWTDPSPSWAIEQKNFEDGLFSTDVAGDFDMVCFLRGNFSDPMCEHLMKASSSIDFEKLKTTPYLYTPDKYWDKYASIPRHSSVMVINGGLDFQTPREWGVNEFEGLQGGNGKILVDFDAGVHCAGISLQTMSDKTLCGFRIISSFVLGGGDVSKVDTSCMNALPGLDFADLRVIQLKVYVKSADELYDSK